MYKTRQERLAKKTRSFSAKDHLYDFLDELSEMEKGEVSLKTYQGAERIKFLMNTPTNKFRTLSDRQYQGYWQEIDFVPSNLGPNKGFLAYWICCHCSRRVKYLYQLELEPPPYCRDCNNLVYEQPNRRKRGLSRLFKKPYLTDYDKELLIKHTGITEEDIVRAKKWGTI